MFYAQPDIIRAPKWKRISDRVANVPNRKKAIPRLAFGLHKRQLALALEPLLQGSDESIIGSDLWQYVAASATVLSFGIARMAYGYEDRTCYNIATKQLYLYPAGRPGDS